jgi:N-acylglucosamine 2-epimerase
MLSRLLFDFQDHMDSQKRTQIREAAERGARFLKDHALLPNGNCAWVLNEKGTPILTDRDGRARQPLPGERYDLGINADEFLIYGMGEFARAANSEEYLDFTLTLFDSVQNRLASGNYTSYPHDEPVGYRAHGTPMIMLETAQELADVAAHFGHPAAERLQSIARESMKEIFNTFFEQEEAVLLEYVKEDNSPALDEMLGSFINPGHSLEDAWFIMHFATRSGDRESLERAIRIVRRVTGKAWDQDFGGLPQFLHIDGGPPRGKIAVPNRDDHMIVELTENWSNKLWWVHSEALYALMLAYEHLREDWYLDTYWKFHEYVFSTFPNPNREVGEWIQIRDREGRPEEKVVALPVKDPYHITRAFMHVIKSLERMS